MPRPPSPSSPGCPSLAALLLCCFPLWTSAQEIDEDFESFEPGRHPTYEVVPAESASSFDTKEGAAVSIVLPPPHSSPERVGSKVLGLRDFTMDDSGAAILFPGGGLEAWALDFDGYIATPKKNGVLLFRALNSRGVSIVAFQTLAAGSVQVNTFVSGENEAMRQTYDNAWLGNRWLHVSIRRAQGSSTWALTIDDGQGTRFHKDDLPLSSPARGEQAIERFEIHSGMKSARGTILYIDNVSWKPLLN